MALVTFVAIAAGLPGSIALRSQSIAPFWYKALASITDAIGISAVGITIGAIVLIAARGKKDGGVKGAIVAAVVVGLISSWSVLYGLQRGA